MSNPLIEVSDLKVHFPMRQGITLQKKAPSFIKAVDGVSFDIRSSEVLALVGESGCGKTTIGKTILQLIEPTTGTIYYEGEDLTHLRGRPLQTFRQKMQLIFQDPYESLDPRQSVYEILAEPLIIHKRCSSKMELEKLIHESLESAGLHPAREFMGRYPHLLSGGQRQRVAIAAAMILQPEFVVTDEPVSMLDVSIRADILKLMLDLREQKRLTYLFITHDLSLAWMIADRILVLYLGKIVELGPANEIIHHAYHPYTQALISVIPLAHPIPDRKQKILQGETPSSLNTPTGCRFHPRCWYYQELGYPEECILSEPDLLSVNEQHSVACHFVEKGA